MARSAKTTKRQVCEKWIKTKACANDISTLEVMRAYKAAAELVSCKLIYKDLRRALLQFLREWLLKNLQPDVILEGMKDLDAIPQHDVRESCVGLIEDVVCHQLHIVNDKRLLTGLSHCR